MSETVLVTYATRYGSTKEVAEKIAENLKKRGGFIDIIPSSQVTSIKKYQFIVIGAPFYVGRMLKDAKSFMLKFKNDLPQKKVAFFALGPLRNDEKDISETKLQLETELEKYPWVKPITMEMFGGKYDPDNLNFMDKFLTKPSASPLHGLEAIDIRNWDAITKWAEDLPVN